MGVLKWIAKEIAEDIIEDAAINIAGHIITKSVERRGRKRATAKTEQEQLYITSCDCSDEGMKDLPTYTNEGYGYCPYCGNQQPKRKVKYCTYCGEKLNE